MTVIECYYTDPPHKHTYPDDWTFGGADGLHPAADPRFKPSTYTYYDADASTLFTTSAPLCDDEALDNFTQVAAWFPRARPTWLAVKRPGEKATMLPWTYNRETDLLSEVVK